jgi:hypothetical protein
MPFIAHVALHLSMCNAIARSAPTTSVQIVVHAQDQTGRQKYDQQFTFERGTSNIHSVDFDTPRGIFLVWITAPKFNCNAVEYLGFLTDHARNVSVTLSDGKPPRKAPMLLMGTAPESFASYSPAFVLLDKSVACDKPVGDLIPVEARIESATDAYYEEIFPTPENVARGDQIALQVATPTGEYHYVRIKIPLRAWDGWPSSIEFNLPDDMFDILASKPTEVLTCLRLTRTSAG